MIKATTGIKYLRRLGIVLITLPEVITTPFGVALLLTARYLSQKLEANLLKRLRETVKLYLVYSKPLRDDTDGKSGAPRRAKHSTQSENRLISRQQKDSCSFESKLVPLVRPERHDTADDAVHHSVDMKWLSRRYGTIEGLKVEPGDSDLEAAPDEADKLTHHSIDRQMLSRRYKADDSSTTEADSSETSGDAEKTIHHTINKEALSRRFKGEDSSEADSNSTNTPDTAKEAVHHSVNRKLPSQRKETEEAPPEKTKHHTINMTSLLRRYGLGSTQSRKTT